MKTHLSVNAAGLLIFMVLIIGLTKLSSYLEPLNLYFRFSTLFMGSDVKFEPLALLIKLAVPVMSGISITVFAGLLIRSGPGYHLNEHSRLLHFLRFEALRTAQLGGFLASLFLAWPMVVHWDVLAAQSLNHRFQVFLLIYFCYSVAFFYLSGVGAKLGMQMLPNTKRMAVGVEPLLKDFELLKSSVLSTVFGSVASYTLANISTSQ